MKMLRNIGSLAFVLVMAIVLSSQNLMARVGDPPPVSDGTRTFRSHKNYVEAVDSASGQVLWRTVLYKRWKPVIRNPFVEEDVQWNIITSLNLNGNVLTVVNKKGSTYFLDARTGDQVRDPIHNQNWTTTVAIVTLIVLALFCTTCIIRRKTRIS
jgi:outer membrane protein assembly factor BamB